VTISDRKGCSFSGYASTLIKALDFFEDRTRIEIREFTLLCEKLELFSGDLVAIDGSKFKAVNSRAKNFKKEKLKKAIEKLDEDIDRYLDEMDEADEEEPQEKKLTAEELQRKIDEMKRMRDEAKGLENQLDESGQSQISLTDPDSRSMPLAGGPRTQVAYNVQISVDGKHKLILDHEVTNEVTDRNLLSQMAVRAKEALGLDELEVLTDMGYYDGQQVKDCLEEDITPYILKADTSANKKLGLFSKSDFNYDQ